MLLVCACMFHLFQIVVIAFALICGQWIGLVRCHCICGKMCSSCLWKCVASVLGLIIMIVGRFSIAGLIEVAFGKGSRLLSHVGEDGRAHFTPNRGSHSRACGHADASGVE